MSTLSQWRFTRLIPCLFLAIWVIFQAPKSSPAQVFSTEWTQPLGGLYSDTANWSDGLPTFIKRATFNLPGTYTVQLVGDENIGGMSVNWADVQFVGGSTISFNNSLAVNSVLTLGASTHFVVNSSLNINSITTGGWGRLILADNATTTSHDLFIGSINGDNGLLDLQSLDASLQCDNLYFGTPDGVVDAGSGIIDIGADSRLIVGNLGLATENGLLLAGDGDTGKAFVRHGATISTDYFQVGELMESKTGSMELDGIDTELSTPTAKVLDGSIEVNNGAKLSVGSFALNESGIEVAGPSVGTPYILLGSGSSLVTDGNLDIGNSATTLGSVSNIGVSETPVFVQADHIRIGNEGWGLFSLDNGTVECNRLEMGLNSNALVLFRLFGGSLNVAGNIELGGTGGVSFRLEGADDSMTQVVCENLNLDSVFDDGQSTILNANQTAISVSDDVVLTNSDLDCFYSTLDVGNDFGADGGEVYLFQTDVNIGGGVDFDGYEFSVLDSMLNVTGDIYVDCRFVLSESQVLFGEQLTSTDELLTYVSTSIIGGLFANEGDVIVETGACDFFCDVENSGQFVVRPGRECRFLQDFQGVGNFVDQGMVGFNARVATGPGVASFEGDVSLATSAMTVLEINGANPNNFSNWNIDNDFAVDGQLILSVDPSIEITAGTTQVVFKVGGTLSGQFAGLNEGDVVYAGNGGELTITYAGGDGNDIALVSRVRVAVEPDSLTVKRGALASGNVSTLTESDNQDVSIQRAILDFLPRTEFEATFPSPTATPATLDVRLEGAVFARSTIRQSVSIFNVATANWEEISQTDAALVFDRVDRIEVTGNLSNYVNAGQQIRVRVRYQSPVQRQSFASNTDQLLLRIGIQ